MLELEYAEITAQTTVNNNNKVKSIQHKKRVKETHAVLACVDVDIDLRYSVKCCPAKALFLTPQITETTTVNAIKQAVQSHLPDAVVVIRELFVIKSKLIHKVRSHLLDLVV